MACFLRGLFESPYLKAPNGIKDIPCETGKRILKKRRKIMVSWLCSKCGYALEADTPPEECPSCKSDCSFVDNSCYTPDCAGTPNDPQVKGEG